MINKDRVGAALLMALGAFVCFAGFFYRIGTLTRMGAGYFPVMLGVVLLGTGLAIGISAQAPVAREGAAVVRQPWWLGWVCILGGIAAFVVLGSHGGLVPATFVSVFITAMGDRNNSWRSALALAVVMTAVAALIFGWALQLQMPLFGWE